MLSRHSAKRFFVVDKSQMTRIGKNKLIQFRTASCCPVWRRILYWFDSSQPVLMSDSIKIMQPASGGQAIFTGAIKPVYAELPFASSSEALLKSKVSKNMRAMNGTNSNWTKLELINPRKPLRVMEWNEIFIHKSLEDKLPAYLEPETTTGCRTANEVMLGSN